MAEITKQKKKRELSAEEQAIVDAIKAQKEKLAAIRKVKAEASAKYRNARTHTMYALISFVERNLKQGGKNSIDLIQALINDIKPTDTIDENKAKEIKEAVSVFFTSNTKK